MAINKDTLVKTSELAAVLGLSIRRIQQLIQDGKIRTVANGSMNLSEAVQDYIKTVSVDDMADVEIERMRKKADAELKAAKATKAKMEVSELEGSMHRSEDVAALTGDLIFAVREALLAFPGRVAVDVHAAKSAAEASAVIKAEVNNVLDELYNYKYDPQAYMERVRQRYAMEGDTLDADDE